MKAVRILVGLAGLLLLMSLSKCGEKEQYPDVVPISFLPAVAISPTSRTMQVGDTLWLEANYSDSLPDRLSGRRFRVRPEDLIIKSSIIHKRLIGIGQEPPGIAPTFRLVEKLGKAQVQGALSSSFQPVYTGHSYQAKIGLIPTKPGVTAISLLIRFVKPDGDSNTIGWFMHFIPLPRDAQGREQKAVLEDSFFSINGGKANNFDLFQQHTRAYSLGPNASVLQTIYEQQSTFTVEVKE